MLWLHYAENHTRLIAAPALRSHHYIWCAENLNIIIFSLDASTGSVFFEFQLNAYRMPLSLISPHILYELQNQFDFMKKSFNVLKSYWGNSVIPKTHILHYGNQWHKATFWKYCFRSGVLWLSFQTRRQVWCQDKPWLVQIVFYFCGSGSPWQRVIKIKM